MLYQDADDQILEQDITFDLNEAERVGSSDRVKVVAQLDRFRGAYQGDGNWFNTRRYLVEQDDDLNNISSKVVQDVGEVDMSDGDTLVDFVDWAVSTYPADNYVLVMSDHGMGWPGGWSDPVPGGSVDRSSPMSAKLGNHIFLMELEEALNSIQQKTGIDKFEMIGMDACLMAQVEVFSMLEPYARYAVASEEVEPGLGWAYAGFLQALVDNPDIDGAQLSKLIVENYIEADQRIVDDEARAEFLRANSPSGGFLGMFRDVTPSQLASQVEKNSTLTAVDLSKIPAVMASLNQLSYSLQSVSQPEVARARTYAQSYTSIFGDQVPPSYIDLGSFTTLLANEISNPALQQAADDLLKGLNSAVIAEKHGSAKPGSTGVAIYFPASQLYRSSVAGPQSYTVIAGSFASASLWDDFLAYHYTGNNFEPEENTRAVPSSGSTVRGPGAGAITVSGLQSSSDTAAPGQPVTLHRGYPGRYSRICLPVRWLPG